VRQKVRRVSPTQLEKQKTPKKQTGPTLEHKRGRGRYQTLVVPPHGGGSFDKGRKVGKLRGCRKSPKAKKKCWCAPKGNKSTGRGGAQGGSGGDERRRGHDGEGGRRTKGVARPERGEETGISDRRK